MKETKKENEMVSFCLIDHLIKEKQSVRREYRDSERYTEKVKLINEEETEKENVKNHNAKSKKATKCMYLTIGNK